MLDLVNAFLEWMLKRNYAGIYYYDFVEGPERISTKFNTSRRTLTKGSSGLMGPLRVYSIQKYKRC